MRSSRLPSQRACHIQTSTGTRDLRKVANAEILSGSLHKSQLQASEAVTNYKSAPTGCQAKTKTPNANGRLQHDIRAQKL